MGIDKKRRRMLNEDDGRWVRIRKEEECSMRMMKDS